MTEPPRLVAAAEARPDVVGFGEAMVLLQPPAAETLDEAAALEVHSAGAELNACAAITALGRRATLVTRLGDDAFGRRIRRAAGHRGVGLACETDPTRPTGVFVKDVRPDGARRVSYYRAGSAASAMDEGDAERGLLLRPRAVLVSGLTAALGPGPARLVEHIGRHAADHGSALVLDVNLRPALGRLDSTVRLLLAMLSRVDLLVLGTDESEPLFGTSDPAEIVRRARQAGVREVVVKAGEQGCWWTDADGESRPMRSLAARVVDPVGAGDAFTGGYLTARLAGADTRQAAALGSRLAAGVLADVGDTTGLPRRAEGVRLLAAAVADSAGAGVAAPFGVGRSRAD
ncbi:MULTISPECIES: sugar kinase [Actinoalloteichus]|uniref:Sugar kinase, ribokinase n=1 Tax=Actinoalloteichus fjordicus TaxID=1612552 RepID=A0AAC9PTJ1_9PSEU|nr:MULTISPECIES: sugar kinase [Actinoalloteichus]APU15936.1 sugar kinase, ribokinase [Actinoalloteichus fjordicus]APU21998.1 sugar kinase, ribokinase [Actinoalloteichus sp. GBA129-24]